MRRLPAAGGSRSGFRCATLLLRRGSVCSAQTFAEQIPGLTARHARRSPLLRRMLEAIGLALAARAGARLGRRARDARAEAVLRLIRALPDPEIGRGGSWAWTISRSAGGTSTARSSSTWLPIARWTCSPIGVGDTHRVAAGPPGVQIVSATRPALTPRPSAPAPPTRSRSRTAGTCGTTSPRASRRPSARSPRILPPPPRRRPTRLRARRGRGPKPVPIRHRDGPIPPRYGPAPPDGSSARVERTRERYAAVHDRGAGQEHQAIMPELGLAGDRAPLRPRGYVEELRRNPDRRTTVLDDYKPYLHQRWNAGGTNASVHAEIATRATAAALTPCATTWPIRAGSGPTRRRAAEGPARRLDAAPP